MKSCLLFFGVIVFFICACTKGNESIKEKSFKKEYKKNVSKPVKDQEQMLKKMAVASDSKIQRIDKQCMAIERESDWTDLINKEVWGTTSVGSADFYYLGSQLKYVRFYPEDKTGGSRVYDFYFENDHLIKSRLLVYVIEKHDFPAIMVMCLLCIFS